MITAVARAAVPAKPSLDQWQELVRPTPEQADLIVPGRRAEEPLPRSIEEVRRQVAGLGFHPLDPYVASVGASIAADQNKLPEGETTVEVAVDGYYDETVEVQMGTQNGPSAPMLVILPGIHSDGEGSHSLLLKKLALERGMNYVMVPNSLSPAMLDDRPVYHPGNPRVDALATHQLLETLQGQFPEYFRSISVAGYSYGALHGANLVRLDEEQPQRLIDGGLVAISPPDNLEHSMRELDRLREVYANGSGTLADTGIRYKRDVKKFGYDRFMESKLALHGPGTNLDEVEIADKYGSRDGLKQLTETLDVQFGHNQLPMNTPEYKEAGWIERLKMRNQHRSIIDNMTYDQLSRDWIGEDEWLVDHGLTPGQAAERYSFGEAMEAIKDTPVLMLGAADDYILAPADVDSQLHLAAHPGPLEVVRVFDTGGHVGVDWNRQVAETMIDFAAAAPNLK